MQLATLWGQLLKRARVDAGLNQRELAEKVGVKQASVARWEAGAVEIRDRHKAAAAEALGKKVDELFPWVSVG